MKKLFLFYILVQHCFVISNGQVIVYLQNLHKNSLVYLDSIILDDLSSHGHVALTASKEINTYKIDLINGQVINGLPGEIILGSKCRVLINRPGFSTIVLHDPVPEPVLVDIYALTGEPVHRWIKQCSGVSNTISLTISEPGLFVCNIHCSDFSFRFKMIGGPGLETACKLLNDINGRPLYRSFSYQPGDTVQFTAFKEGFYRNFQICAPQNGDSITIFLTAPCPGEPIVKDVDNNIYSTVLINNQCWMRENMRTKHYANGTALVDGTGKGDITADLTTRYWFDYDDDPANSEIYGKLYTAAAALRGIYDRKTQGICPNSWHVSSNIEWCEMEKIFDPTINANCMVGEGSFGEWIGTYIREKFCEVGTNYWDYMGWLVYTTNESGFTALPGGERIPRGIYGGMQVWGGWWLSREAGQNSSENFIPSTAIEVDQPGVFRIWNIANNGESVRCVRDY